jgi:hypothetical protein
MKRKSLQKSLFLGVCSMSLAAFLFVNVHASLTLSQSLPVPVLQQQTQAEEKDDQQYDLPQTNLSLIGRILETAHRLLPSIP